MQVKNETLIDARPEQVVEFMLSPTFIAKLCVELDAVRSIEELESTQEGATLRRVVQYQAPTQSKIPSFLSKYKDKAPEFVYWKEIATWDLDKHQMTYVIEPDIPEKWHSYYDVSGQLRCIERSGKTMLATSLTYEVNVFGLKRLIERALKAEVENMLRLQGDIIKRHPFTP